MSVEDLQFIRERVARIDVHSLKDLANKTLAIDRIDVLLKKGGNE